MFYEKKNRTKHNKTRETEDNGYAKCWGDKQRALWYVMVFFVVLNCATTVNMSVIVKLIILNTLPIDAV